VSYMQAAQDWLSIRPSYWRNWVKAFGGYPQHAFFRHVDESPRIGLRSRCSSR